MFEERGSQPNNDQGGQIWEETFLGQTEREKLDIVGYTAFEDFAAQGVWPLQKSHEHQAFQLLQSCVSDRLEMFSDDREEYLSLKQGLTFRSPLMGEQRGGSLVVGAQAVLHDPGNRAMVFDGSLLYPLPEGLISNLAIIRLKEMRGERGDGWTVDAHCMVPLYSCAAFRCEVELLCRQKYDSPHDLQEASLIAREAVSAAQERVRGSSLPSKFDLKSEDGQLHLDFDCGTPETLHVAVMLNPNNGQFLFQVRGPR